MTPETGHGPQLADAYRQGKIDARLEALERGGEDVSASIKATERSLQHLSDTVNELRLMLKMLEMADLVARVTDLEKAQVGVRDVGVYRRWLFGASLAVVGVLVALLSQIPHF